MKFIDEHYFLFEEIVKRYFASKYKGSFLGILWSVVKPLLIMTLLTIIFSSIFGGRIENYPVYYLAGKCMYDFFTASTSLSLNSIKGNKNILKKTNVPKYTFVLGAIASEFINFIISLILFIGVMIVTRANFYFTTPLVIIPIISLIMLITGVGLILSILCVYYTDIQHLWGVVTMLVMYASALFYPMDIIPDPFHKYMILNPLYWLITQFRCFFIWGIIPDLLNIINSILVSSIILVFGIIVFKKYQNKIAIKL